MRFEHILGSAMLGFFGMLGFILYAVHAAEIACIEQGGTYAGTLCIMCKSAE